MEALPSCQTIPLVGERLCTIVQAAEGRAEPCPGDQCVYWEKGCILDGVEPDLLTHPAVAAILLRLREELEQANHYRVTIKRIRDDVKNFLYPRTVTFLYGW